MPKSNSKKQAFTDIPQTSWLYRWLPETWLPYAKTLRLDRPIGIWLLVFPGWWAIAMVAPPSRIGYLFLLFLIGATVMRGAGCAYNDWVDIDFDTKVTRTKSRPYASGQLNGQELAKLIAGCLVIAFIILMALPLRTILIGLIALIPVAIYPWMKRYTYWPQLFLGFAFNWGALLGWTAATNKLTFAAWLLYFAGIFWTIIYDTIYAHQDKEEDLLIGLKSTAIKFGNYSLPILLGFTALMTLFLIFSGAKAGLSWPFYIMILSIAGCVSYQLFTLDFKDPNKCLEAFKEHRYVGWAVLFAIALGRVF